MTKQTTDAPRFVRSPHRIVFHPGEGRTCEFTARKQKNEATGEWRDEFWDVDVNGHPVGEAVIIHDERCDFWPNEESEKWDYPSFESDDVKGILRGLADDDFLDHIRSDYGLECPYDEEAA